MNFSRDFCTGVFRLMWRSLLCLILVWAYSYLTRDITIEYVQHYAGNFGRSWSWWCLCILCNGDVPTQSCQGRFPLCSNADKWKQCPWHVPTAGWSPVPELICWTIDIINESKRQVALNSRFWLVLDDWIVFCERE